MTLALLGKFRAEWLDGPLPMIVEHRPSTPERICAAPSLWMGGKYVADALRARSLGAGRTVRYSGTSTIEWIQSLVGSLRAGTCFDCRPEVEGIRFDATIAEGLEVESDGGDAARREPDSSLLLFQDGVAMNEEQVEAAARDAAAALSGSSQRIATRGAWGDWRPFALELLAALQMRLEVHVVHRGVAAHTLRDGGSLPDVMVVSNVNDLVTDPAWASSLRVAIAYDDDLPDVPSVFTRRVDATRDPFAIHLRS